MDLNEIVKKLVGKINPVGETTTDNERFENLRVLCDLVENLIIDIDNVNYQNKQSHEYSVKRAAEYADNFLTKTIGITE
jgi:hypothetical protein